MTVSTIKKYSQNLNATNVVETHPCTSHNCIKMSPTCFHLLKETSRKNGAQTRQYPLFRIITEDQANQVRTTITDLRIQPLSLDNRSKGNSRAHTYHLANNTSRAMMPFLKRLINIFNSI